MKPVEPTKIDVALVHDVEGSGLENHMVEQVNIVCLTACNTDKRWNIASQVQLRMDFDGTFVLAMLSPWKQGQGQVDDG